MARTRKKEPVDAETQDGGPRPVSAYQKKLIAARLIAERQTNIPVTESDATVSDRAPDDDGAAKAPQHLGIMSIGTTAYRLNADKSVDVWRGERLWDHGTRKTDFELGVLKDVANVDGIPITTGLTVIFGVANRGKTPLLRYIQKNTNADIIYFGEPFPGYLRTTTELAARMLESENPCICVDSMKQITSRVAGNATSGGLSKEFFATLSDMSSFFAERGQAVIVVVNVSSQRDEVLAESMQSLDSNGVGLIRIESPGHLVWLVRSSMGQQRRQGSSRIKWAGDGVIERLTGDSAPDVTTPRFQLNAAEPDVSVAAAETTSSPLNYTLDNALRRTLPADAPRASSLHSLLS